MTRITNFNPPPAIAALLQGSLNINRASRVASASAYPTRRPPQPPQAKMSWPRPNNLGQVADWLIAYGPASWRDGSRPAIRTEILNDLARRSFATEYWTAPTPATDRIEVSYPSVDRSAYPPPDPQDPQDTANTDCDYEYRSIYWPFSQASAGGWPPLPDWAGVLDADRYFVDTWHAQRALTYLFPPQSISNQRAFVFIHLQGTISATAATSGVKLWFTPLAVANFFSSQSTADNFHNSIAAEWTHLYDAHLPLPPTNLGWSHTVPIDLVFKLGATGWGGWTTAYRWLNLKLSTRAPCGVYRASNAWAECRVDLQIRVFYPSFLA